MTWRTLIVMVLAAPLALCGYSCGSGNKGDAMMPEPGERWVLAGHYVNPRDPGRPSENWVATLEIPDGTMIRLLRIPMTTPDGKTELFPTVAYNEAGNLMICSRTDLHGGNLCNDVWRYDPATGQSRWIAKGQWNKTRGFAWCPDGSKVAFVASIRGSPAAFVMQYDVHTDKLDEVAGDAFGNLGDGQSGDSSVRPRRPAYSEDGHWLYYVAMDRHVMRVDLLSKQCMRLPFTDAIAVLTVRDEHLVYAKEVAKGRDARFQIIKVRLDAPDDSHSQQIYSFKGMLHRNFVSPSRRFILVEARAGYAADRRMLDVDRGITCGAGGLLTGGGFYANSTVFVRVTGP